MSRDDFEARLNRVNEAKAGAPPRPLIRPRRAYIQEKKHLPTHIIGVAILATVMTIAVFNGGLVSSDHASRGVSPEMRLMQADSAQTTTTQWKVTGNEVWRDGPQSRPRIDIGQTEPTRTPKAAPEPKRVVVAAPTPAVTKPALTPAYTYLPGPLRGWIAVTQEDSPTTMGSGGTKAEREKVGADHARAIQEGIDRVAARYPGGHEALEQHPHFRKVKGQISSLPLTRSVFGSRPNYGTVLFVHPDGRYLDLEMRIHPAVEAFGPADEPDVWGDAIVARMTKGWSTKGVPTDFMGFKGGVSYLDTTTLTYFDQPKLGKVPTGFNMVIALNHRTELKILGNLSPEDLRLYLRAFDLDALRERAEKVQ